MPDESPDKMTADNGGELVCEPGAHGIRPEFLEEEISLLLHTPAGDEGGMFLASEGEARPTYEEQVKTICEEFADIEGCATKPVSRAPFEEGARANTINKSSSIAVIMWGKLHRYPLESWEKIAPKWRSTLLRECDITLRGLELDIDCLERFLELGEGVIGSFVSGTSELIGEFKAWWKDKKFQECPETSEFIALQKRVESSRASLSNLAEIDHEILLDAAIELMRVNRTRKEIDRRFARHRCDIIDGAESAVKGLVVVESTSFAILDLGATAYAMGDPVREAAYKISVAMLHAGSKGAGEALAGSSGKEILRALHEQIRKDLPGILSGAFMAALGKRGLFKKKSRAEALAKTLIEIKVTLLFETIDFALFEMTTTPAEQREEKLREWAENQFYEKITEAIAAVAVAVISPPGASDSKIPLSLKKKARKIGATVAASAIKGLVGDWRAAEKTAEKEHKEALEVFLEELPWTVIRLITSTAVALSKGAVEGQVKAEMKSGESRAFGKRLYWTEEGTEGEDNYRARLSLKRPDDDPPPKPIEKKADAAKAPKRSSKRKPVEPAEEEAPYLPLREQVIDSERRKTVMFDNARAWIESHDYPEELISGFDKDMPILETTLQPGERVRQYIQVPYQEWNPDQKAYVDKGGVPGAWFAIEGATLDNLTLNSGLTGRYLVEFEVVQPVTVLEGYAAETFMPEAEGHQEGYGVGVGGASQFLFPKGAAKISLRRLGPVDP